MDTHCLRYYSWLSRWLGDIDADWEREESLAIRVDHSFGICAYCWSGGFDGWELRWLNVSNLFAVQRIPLFLSS